MSGQEKDEFWELLAKYMHETFVKTLSEKWAEEAMLEYAKLYVPEIEHEKLGVIARNEPSRLYLMAAKMGFENPEGLAAFLNVAKEAIKLATDSEQH